MSKLRIGLFPQFKGKDSVLLEGTHEEIGLLASRLNEFGQSQESELPVHAEANVSERHPVQLFAVRQPSCTGSGAGQRWLCSVK